MILRMLTLQLLNNTIAFGSGIYFMQIIPDAKEGVFGSSAIPYLITCITILASTIGFLFIYTKSLNKIIKSSSEQHSKQLQDIYENHLEDYKDLTEKNIRAFTENTASNREIAASTRELKEASHNLSIWLREIVKK